MPREKAQNDSLVGKLGPGLITGAADDDPSGIAAYSQSGAQFGFSLLWTLFFTYPLMVGIQVVSARIGRVSGYGLAGNIRRAGKFAFLLFSMGIIGTGLLAAPVLAGSAAFAVAESFGWRRGLDLTPLRGARFYRVIAAATLVGVGLGFTQLDPIKALFYTAVINGVISAPIMVVMMRMASNPKIMGQFVVTRRLRILGWAATTVMAIAVAAMFIQARG